MDKKINFFSKAAFLLAAVFILSFLALKLAKAQGIGETCGINGLCDQGLVCDTDDTCQDPNFVGGGSGSPSTPIEIFCEPLSTGPNNQARPQVYQQCVDLIKNQLSAMNRTQAEAALKNFGSAYYSGANLNNFVNNALALGTYQGASGSGGGGAGGGNGGGSSSGLGAGNNNSSGGGIDCGNANLEVVNGLCLPKSSGSGLAGATDWVSLAKNIINIFLYIAGTIAVLFVLYGGSLYITSGGNEETAEKGRKALINAIIGLVVVILSYTIVNVLVNLITVSH